MTELSATWIILAPKGQHVVRRKTEGNKFVRRGVYIINVPQKHSRHLFLYELTNQKENDLKTNYSFYNDMILSYNKYTCMI